MKNIKYFAAAVLTCALGFLPLCVSAQTTTPSPYYQGVYNDGSSTPWNVRSSQFQEYRRQSNEMQQKISALPSTAIPSVFMPVLFGVGVKDISPNFGDPRSGGRTHEGEDIMAVKGTPIVSPTPAVVLRTGVGDTEGNYVYTANPGGETFVYMHLDRIGEGVTNGVVLAQGGLIGYVGNTGNAAGGPAHLHFEIHNNSGTPTDPFPRLTGEFTLQEKITYLATILTQTSDSTALAQFLVINFRGMFLGALANNIPLPQAMTDALATIPASASVTANGASIPYGDMDIGSTGPLVVALQNYLIQAAKDGAASRLAQAGATGNFGVLTKAALIEFQVAVGISPATGYYGPTTKAYIDSHPLAITSTPPPAGAKTPVVDIGPVKFPRNLSVGVTGEDVRLLQITLNAKGFTVATTGAGSVGHESTYFGLATKAAVINFQYAHNISPTGNAGPLTRAALNAL